MSASGSILSGSAAPGRVLLAIAAHADDAELNAGGTMAKWARDGGRVVIVMVTNNCSGLILPTDGDETKRRRLGPAETCEIRRREQQAAADRIGATMHWLDFAQRHYWDPKAEREVEIGYGLGPTPLPAEADRPQVLLACHEPTHVEALAGLIAAERPAIVLSHGPLDLDGEHHAVASLAWRAMARARDALPETPLRFWTPGGSCPGGMCGADYDHIEDISGTMDVKRDLCACHASQMTRARWQRLEDEARRWGETIGVDYAEPFATATLPAEPRGASG